MDNRQSQLEAERRYREKNILNPKEMYNIDDIKNTILCGDSLIELKKIPNESVDLVITSPPYYALRDYQVEGQLGLEKSFESYQTKLLEIIAEIKRVLKPSGQFWLNLGDIYGTGSGAGSRKGSKQATNRGSVYYENKGKQAPGEQKCLMMMPERIAIAMCDSGWILRNRVCWCKQILDFKEKRTKGSVMPTCLSPETEVYIKDEAGVIAPHKLKELLGWNIENLQILSPTGWKKIKNIWQVEKDRIMNFQVGSSSEIACSLQHRFPISHDNRRKRYEIKEAQELRENSQRTLDRFLFKPITDFIPDMRLEIDGKILTFQLGKFIGLYAAEGGFADYSKFKSFQGKFTLNKQEDDLAKEIIDGLNLFGVKYRVSKIKNYQSIVFNSKEVKDFISRFVLGKCKEKRLDMVTILNTNREFRRGIFEGLIAGDGHIDKNKRVSFGSASKQLRDDLYLLASSIDLLASRHESHRKDKRTNKIYDGYYLTIPLSLQNEKIVGERECVKGKPLTAKYKNVFSAKTLKFCNPKITKENRFFIDIEVEDGLFLINGGIVSHNSVKDRFNESWEYLYFFVKNKKYYSDLNAVRLKPQTFENRPDGFTRSREFEYDSKRLADYSPQSKQSGQRFNCRVRDAKRKLGQLQYKASEKEIKNYKQVAKDYGKKKLVGIDDKKLGNRWMSGTPNFLKQNKVNDPRGNHEGGLGSWQDFKDKHPYKPTYSEWLKTQNVEHYKDKGVSSTRGGGSMISKYYDEIHNGIMGNPLGKNLPTCWLIGSEPHNFKNELGVELDHFAIFPQALLEIPIKFGCTEKGLVLDPFMGSGQTALMARQLGRNYLGIELNESYIELAKKRLAQQILF